MNPNTTTSYMAAQAKHRQMERNAERGWLAEQAAAAGNHESHRSDRLDVTLTFTRLIGLIGAWPLRLIRATIDSATPRLVRIGRGLAAR
jgi:hypothetical protein